MGILNWINLNKNKATAELTVIETNAGEQYETNMPQNQIQDTTPQYDFPAPVFNEIGSSILLSDIPSEILNLLWFQNGEFENCADLSEPSIININLPISENINPNLIEQEIDYYPKYAQLSPNQRRIYLDWLADISKPIPIGYVFIFYYGLERYLFTDKYLSAIQMIKKLQQYHSNASFKAYSTDGIIIGCKIHNNIHELDNYLNAFQNSKSSLIYRLCSIYLKRQITAKEIIELRRKWGFTNNRYISAYPEMFEKVLTEKIIEEYGKNYIDISPADYLKSKKSITLALANYSLSNRTGDIKDITTNQDFANKINSLLNYTHEQIKNCLKEERNNKAN